MITFIGIVVVVLVIGLAYLYAIVVDLSDDINDLNEDVAYIYYRDEEGCECEPYEQLPIVTKPKKKVSKKK